MRKVFVVCLVVCFSISLLTAQTQQATIKQPAAQNVQKKQVPAKLQVPAPTYSHADFPIEKTENYIRWNNAPEPLKRYPGCRCGFPQKDGDGVPPGGAKEMTVSPPSVKDAVVGKPVTLRYDASRICLGQTIANTNGVDSPDPRAPDNPNLKLGFADWDVEGFPTNQPQSPYFQTLPREWGDITMSYPKSGEYTVRINVTVWCKDIPGNKVLGSEVCPTTGFNVCKTEVDVPVTVK